MRWTKTEIWQCQSQVLNRHFRILKDHNDFSLQYLPCLDNVCLLQEDQFILGQVQSRLINWLILHFSKESGCTNLKCNIVAYVPCGLHTKDTLLKGKFGVEQLRPCPQFDNTPMGINYKNVKRKVLSVVGGRLNYWRCRKIGTNKNIANVIRRKSFVGRSAVEMLEKQIM